MAYAWQTAMDEIENEVAVRTLANLGGSLVLVENGWLLDERLVVVGSINVFGVHFLIDSKFKKVLIN